MSKSSITLRTYHPDDRQELLQILERVYDAETRKRHELLWDWWQERHCQAPDVNLRPTVVERDGTIVGCIGMQFRRFKFGDEERTGIIACDSFIDPSARGAGLPMIRHMLSVTDILLGAPVPRSNKLWKKVLGQENIDVFLVRKAKRVLDPSHFLSKKGWSWTALPATWAWSAIATGVSLFAPRLEGSEINEVERFPSEADLLCRRWLKGKVNAALRDAEYLNWRFCSGPVAYRKIILRKDGELIGLAVFRVGMMNGRRILLLVEIIAEHKETMKAYGSLIGHALVHGRRDGAADAQSLDTGCPGFRSALRRWGFFFRQEAMPVVGKIGDNLDEKHPFYNVGDWVVSAGDSDLEFTYFNQGFKELMTAIPGFAKQANLQAAHA